MQNKTVALFGRLALVIVSLTVPAHADLKHRYSFSDASGGTAVKDSVGTANGSLHGGATLNGNGTLTLDGNNGYVDLPNGIISQLTNATFEAWVTFSGNGGAWQRVFDFGNNANGEDQQGTGSTYLFLTPRTGTAGLGPQAAWLPASESAAVENGVNKVTVTPGQGARFFRLKR